MTSLSPIQRLSAAHAHLSDRSWTTVEAPEFRDARGALTVCQPGDCVPFEIARVYFIHGVPPSAQRGGHAHRRLEQVIFALGASLSNEPAHAASSPDVCDVFLTEACSIASPIFAEPPDGSVS